MYAWPVHYTTVKKNSPKQRKVLLRRFSPCATTAFIMRGQFRDSLINIDRNPTLFLMGPVSGSIMLFIATRRPRNVALVLEYTIIIMKETTHHTLLVVCSLPVFRRSIWTFSLWCVCWTGRKFLSNPPHRRAFAGRRIAVRREVINKCFGVFKLL